MSSCLQIAEQTVTMSSLLPGFPQEGLQIQRESITEGLGVKDSSKTATVRKSQTKAIGGGNCSEGGGESVAQPAGVKSEVA